MLAEAGNDGKLLAVFTESVKLVGEGSLKLLTRDVGELGLGNERLGFGADKFLLENNDAWTVGFFILELGDLIGNLLLAYARFVNLYPLRFRIINVRTVSAWLHGSFDVANALDSHTVLIVAIDELIFKFANFIDQDTELVCHIRNVVVTAFAPEGKLLLDRLSAAVDRLELNLCIQQLPSFHVQQAPYCA